MRERTPSLEDRMSALDAAVGLADGRLDDGLVAKARAVLDKSQQRLNRGPDVVVAALAGGTGSGKSSLFNALAGEDVSRVGPVRPVTSEVVGLVVGEDESATAVLDWLDVRRRHVAAPGVLADGLILLDLPDNDSVHVEHREIVDRFVERVDVLLWVVDPLKYAQRSLHEGYLRMLVAHARVVVVVLNQIDTLGDDARKTILTDLRRLLDAEGLSKATLLATSARTGDGLTSLRTKINEYVTKRRAVAQRIAGDLGNVANALAVQVGPPAPVTLDADALVRALAVAAGVEPLADTGRNTYVEDANDAARPVVTGAVLKQVRRVRRPLRRIRRPAGASRSEVSPIGVQHAISRMAETAVSGLPHPWPMRLRSAATAAADDLPGTVAKALDRIDVHDVGRRAWWPLMRALGTVVELAALAGILWLVVLGVLAWFRVPEPPLPAIGEVPLPTVLALGGGLLWVLIAVVRRRLVAAGARRHRDRVVTQLQAAVRDAAEQQALEPLQAEVRAHAALAESLRNAAGRPLT